MRRGRARYTQPGRSCAEFASHPRNMAMAFTVRRLIAVSMTPVKWVWAVVTMPSRSDQASCSTERMRDDSSTATVILAQRLPRN